ncbi:MAG: hypothetical protein M1816_005982 [Peltula sp. TS41687]|nr:MAG: hypothetical protein M1816_005982 [Peltula sp. TS41687]
MAERTTWWGCGKHVPSVMDDIAKDEWCTCEPRVAKDGGREKEYPPGGSVVAGLKGMVGLGGGGGN